MPLLLLLPLVGAPAALGAVEGQPSISVVLLQFILLLAAAKIAGEGMERLGQPAVLGELLAGVLIGNLHLVGIPFAESARHSRDLEIFAELGVILLLFEVGLESHLKELTEVGLSALIVATVGVVAPSALGYWVSAWFLPAEAWYVHLFVGTTLAATSVGITARVLKDLGRTEAKESRIILGAAVVDDVLGLVVLAVVSGLVTSIGATGRAQVAAGPVVWIIAKSVLFLAAAIVLSRLIQVNLARWGSRFRVPGVGLIIAITHCFSLAALAGWVGLAPIVGAFAAGLVLEESDYELYRQRGELPIATLVKPISTLFVPVFFVMMGFKVDLAVFGVGGTLGLAFLLTVAAVAGKQVCALGVVERGLDRLTVGLGMIPRGEVGLIFVGLGGSLLVSGKPVLPAAAVSALIVMVMATTLMTPPLLKWAFSRKR